MDASSPTPSRLDAFALRILTSGRLDAKLEPPSPSVAVPDECVGAGASPSPPQRPARALGLEQESHAAPLPRPHDLADPAARALCLARFAHHELMAVELFAWALLRWPEVPGALRAAWVGILEEEQTHCRMYLERLAAHGGRLEHYAPHSDYFWKQVPVIEASPHGPRAFLAAMGLTLEQANLDFTLTYRDGFREAGDEASAAVCQQVHDDEVGHVRGAALWLARLDAAAHGQEPSRPLTDAYSESVPFPLAASRAKGRRFDAAARRRAGLDEAFIEHVRAARSSPESSRRRSGRR